jgi:DNA-binding MarR family transcriptional regulator
MSRDRKTRAAKQGAAMTLILEQFLPYRLVTLSQRISHALSAIYREQFDISVAEWRILANLAEKGELNPSEIAQQTSMDKARVSRAIKELSDRGCVHKRRDEGDNRAYRLSLSPSGLVLYHQIVPLALAWEGELLDALDASEYRDLNRIIEKLGRRLGENGA